MIGYLIFLIYSIGVIAMGFILFSNEGDVQELKEIIEAKLESCKGDDDLYNLAEKIIWVIAYLVILWICLTWPYTLIKAIIGLIIRRRAE